MRFCEPDFDRVREIQEAFGSSLRKSNENSNDLAKILRKMQIFAVNHENHFQFTKKSLLCCKINAMRSKMAVFLL